MTIKKMLLPVLAATVASACAEQGSSSMSRSEPDLTTTSIQDGLLPTKDYLGTRDTYLSESEPDESFGAEIELRADGKDPPDSTLDLVALLSWDLSGLPKRAVVQHATITLHVTNNSKNVYQVYALNRAWDEATATWHKSTRENRWGHPGASAPSDRQSVVLGETRDSSRRTYSFELNEDGVAVIQGWINGTFANNGFAFVNDQASDGIDFWSREAPVATNRPKLTLRYYCGSPANPVVCPEPTVPTAQTVQPTLVPSARPTVPVGPASIPATTSVQKRKNQTAQLLLAELGYYLGVPDGGFGPETRKAIIQFQTQIGTAPDGQVTDELLVQLSREKKLRR